MAVLAMIFASLQSRISPSTLTLVLKEGNT